MSIHHYIEDTNVYTCSGCNCRELWWWNFEKETSQIYFGRKWSYILNTDCAFLNMLISGNVLIVISYFTL